MSTNNKVGAIVKTLHVQSTMTLPVHTIPLLHEEEGRFAGGNCSDSESLLPLPALEGLGLLVCTAVPLCVSYPWYLVFRVVITDGVVVFVLCFRL